jgi:hypothetical protein
MATYNENIPISSKIQQNRFQKSAIMQKSILGFPHTI